MTRIIIWIRNIFTFKNCKSSCCSNEIIIQEINNDTI